MKRRAERLSKESVGERACIEKNKELPVTAMPMAVAMIALGALTCNSESCVLAPLRLSLEASVDCFEGVDRGAVTCATL